MGNRKQPFGYRMTLGEITILPEEAETVRSIYLQYIAGISFKQLAEQLQAEEVPYDEDKSWNKNMVSRILEDDRYIGKEEFPALITAEQFDAAQKRRKEMRPAYKQTPAQKTLRRLCGAPLSERVEKFVTDLLNELIRCPDRVQPVASQVATACGKTREELNSALERQPIDEDNARALLLQLAAEQYDAIGNTEYETVRLRRLLTGRKPMAEPDAELLQSAVSKVHVTSNCVTVTLKNGQTIERRDQL